MTEPIILYQYSYCPYCKKVRDKLNELAIPYIKKEVDQSEEFAKELIEKAGKKQVPFIIDNNTNTQMLESDDIIKYLEKTYGDS